MAGQIDSNCKDDIFPDGKLPGDVMVSILSNLPVKSLLKFKAVSKSWCSLISSLRFIKLHLHRQSLIANCLLMPLKDDDSQYSKYGLLPHNHNKNTTADNDVLILENSPVLLPKEVYRHLKKKQKVHCHLERKKKVCCSILDSCNGLVCVFSSVDLILWNPATRKYRSIEGPRRDVLGYCTHVLAYNTLGLCYVDATNDFKIVVWNRAYTPFDRRYLFVYSMISDSWERLDYDSMSSDSWERFDHYGVKYLSIYHPPTFICGCMNWLAHIYNSVDVIVAYSDAGAMSSFRLPANCGCRSSEFKCKQTLAIRGCLSVVLFPNPLMESEYELGEYVLDVWVMEEYGVEGSWVKRFTIRGLSPVAPIISWNDGEIVFICHNTEELSRRLTFYDPYSKSEYHLDFMSFHDYNVEVFNYVESLAGVEAK